MTSAVAVANRADARPSFLNAPPPNPTALLTDLVAPQLHAVDRLFAQELASDLPHVNELVTHVAKFRGKMLRPMLLLLSGLAASGRQDALTDDHVVLATVVEMVHMATLVHDDILDGAEIRRQGATINHLRGNEAAVLLGDFLISHAYHLCGSLNARGGGGAGTSRLIAHTTNVVCEGELTQNFHRAQLETRRKNLLPHHSPQDRRPDRDSAAALGPCSPPTPGRASTPWRLSAARSAYAFQIVDDILDICGQQKTVGKSLGTDIEKGKLTLPLIHFLKHAAPPASRTAPGPSRKHPP